MLNSCFHCLVLGPLRWRIRRHLRQSNCLEASRPEDCGMEQILRLFPHRGKSTFISALSNASCSVTLDEEHIHRGTEKVREASPRTMANEVALIVAASVRLPAQANPASYES